MALIGFLGGVSGEINFVFGAAVRQLATWLFLRKMWFTFALACAGDHITRGDSDSRALRAIWLCTGSDSLSRRC